MSFDIKRYWLALVTATENPMTPIVVNKLVGSIESLGPILAGASDKQKVLELSDRLMKDFTDEELELGDTNLVMALMSCLSEAIRVWVRRIMR